jgi:lysylphosphatidylglycerol synthetase-like protein (DUF2156 family)
VHDRAGSTGEDARWGAPVRAPVPGLTDRPITVLLLGLATLLGGATLAVASLRSWALVPAGTRLIAPKGITSHPLAGVIIGVQFIVLGRGLLQRRWLASRAMILVVFVGAFVNAVGSSPHRVLALTGLGIGVLVVATRRQYRVEPDPNRVAPTLTTGVAMVLALGVLMTTWILWRHPATSGRPAIGHAARATIAAMAGADGALGQVTGNGAYHLAGALMAVTALIVLAVSIVLLAPHGPPVPDVADRRLVERLVAAPDADGLAPFVLRHDKAYVFSPDGRAAIGYRVVSGIALFGGDPVGERASYPAAINAFLDHAAARGWRPAGIGARGDIAPLWDQRGLRSIGIGDEAVVATESFRLDTPRLRNVRQAVKRSANFGVVTEVRREGELRPAERDEFLAVAEAIWGHHGERGFSMNLDHVLDGERPEVVVALARDADQQAVGFQRYVPSAGGHLLSLDTMVRLPSAPNGVNERMIVDVIDWSRQHGVEHVSLNFAAFRALFETEDRKPFERLGFWGAHRLDRYIRVESLYRFNNKFRPAWVPRSVVFRSWVDVGWVLLAAVQAEFGLRVPGSGESVTERSRDLLRVLPWVDR